MVLDCTKSLEMSGSGLVIGTTLIITRLVQKTMSQTTLKVQTMHTTLTTLILKKKLSEGVLFYAMIRIAQAIGSHQEWPQIPAPP